MTSLVTMVTQVIIATSVTMVVKIYIFFKFLFNPASIPPTLGQPGQLFQKILILLQKCFLLIKPKIPTYLYLYIILFAQGVKVNTIYRWKAYEIIFGIQYVFL